PVGATRPAEQGAAPAPSAFRPAGLAVPGAVVLALLLPGLARAEAPKIAVPRISTPPRIEDFLEGTVQPDAALVPDFRHKLPGDGVPISQETRAYLSYDDKNLYVVFDCRDDPQLVRVRMSKRENIIGDDGVLLYLDTFHDRQRGYVFATNPYGIQLDGLFTE